MPVEYYESIKNHVSKECVMAQKNVHSMSINDKVGLNKQNNSNFVIQKKKHIHTYANIHKDIWKDLYQNVKCRYNK